MRAILLSSIGVVCVAAVAAPTAAPANAAHPSSPAAQERTWTIPLGPLASDTRPAASGGSGTAPAARGLDVREVKPFSLLGVTWNDASVELPGTVQVRTRHVDGGTWSRWQELESHNDDAPDPGSAEGGTRLRGSTAPLWVGPSDAVEVRVVPRTPGHRAERGPEAALPEGLRLDMVDPGPDTGSPGTTGLGPPPDAGTPGVETPGDEPKPPDKSAPGGGQATVDTAPEVPEGEYVVPEGQTNEEAASGANSDVAAPGAEVITEQAAAGGPRPPIVTRAGWHANERLRERNFLYSGRVKVAFVHHSATGNYYTCAQAPALIRSIYRYHVKSSGWRDIGYNFLIDRCGKIYEGRAGGVTKPVMGAHTLGFNRNTTGIAVLGSFGKSKPSAAAVTAVARLSAWKLGINGVNPQSTAVLVAGGGKFKKGTRVPFRTIAGHRDGFKTDCPGARLYSRLPAIRAQAGRFQGR